MEQRNEMLRQMKMSDREKRGDVQHILSKSFSRKSFASIPLSSPAEVTIPVPTLSPNAQATPTRVTIREVSPEIQSIGELSVEPRVAGAAELIDLTTPSPTTEQQRAGPTQAGPSLSNTSHSKKTRRDSDSSSDSEPEEQSVRTPLLEGGEGGEAPATLPIMTQPSIKRYDDMFSERTGEDEIPLGGTADSLVNQP